MANDLNQCQFIGHLGADPEVRYLPSGAAVTNFRIGVGKKWKDKQSGQVQERTTWVRITAFNKLAEICGEYLKKGSKVFVSGEFVERKWQDQSGQDRYSTEIHIERMQMLGGGKPVASDQGCERDDVRPVDDTFDDDIPF